MYYSRVSLGYAKAAICEQNSRGSSSSAEHRCNRGVLVVLNPQSADEFFLQKYVDSSEYAVSPVLECYNQWLKCKIRGGRTLHSGLDPWQWSCAFP